ncbi:hypothetical protein [Alteriqipengyuania sp. 357]
MTSTDKTQSDPFGTNESTNAFFQRLHQLWRDCGAKASRHDTARVLITACIDEGVLEGPRIIGVLSKLGFNRKHVGKTLSQLTGPDPAKCDWYKDDAGKYRNHPTWSPSGAAGIKV